MADTHILITMGLGIASTFLLFFLLHLVVKLSGRFSATLTVLIVWAVYFPLAYFYWPGIDIFAIHFSFFSMTAYGLGIVTYRKQALSDGETLNNAGWFHWAPATIVCFFLILTIVDSNIISFAFKYAPGIVAHDFRKKSGQFNEYLQRVEEQKVRGWQVSGGWDAAPELDVEKPIEMTVLDKSGQPITDAKVTAKLLSTTEPDQDQQIELANMGSGVYRANATLNRPGRWTVVLTVAKDDDIHEVKGSVDVGREFRGN
jgi:nitrogen fixation protein FixH